MKRLITLFFFGLLLPYIGSEFSYERVNADSNSEKTIYVDISKNTKFLEEGSNPYLHYSGGDISLTVTSNNIYQTSTLVDTSSLIGGFTICCFSGSYKTVNISMISFSSFDYICLSSYVDGSDTEIEGYGLYKERTENPGATYRTHRVWANTTLSENEKITAIYRDSNEYVLIDMPAVASAGKMYYYVDIPTSVTSIYFSKYYLVNEDNEEYEYIIQDSCYISSITYGTCYFLNASNYSEYTYGVVEYANIDLLAEVVQGYLTYGKEPSNGAVKSTMKMLFTTWFSKKSATVEEMKAKKILDYSGYAKNGNSYENLDKDTPYSVNEKWNTICSQAGVDPKTGQDRNDLSNWFSENKKIIIIGAAAIVLVGGFVAVLLVKKKKQNS